MGKEREVPYGLKITFLVHFVVAAVFGLVLLLIPEMFGGMMGTLIKEPSTFRLVGSALSIWS